MIIKQEPKFTFILMKSLNFDAIATDYTILCEMEDVKGCST